MRNRITTTCNLCSQKMTGGVPGFIQHGEEQHPEFFLSGAETCENLKFSPKKYWCPLDGKWYSTTKWLTRTLKKLGWSNERYYREHGETHMPDLWAKNTSDPVVGDGHNHDACIQCGKTVKFHDTHWEYSAFCGFKCSTKWYAENTDRPQRAMATVKERQKTDPTLMLTPTQLDYWIVKHGMTKEEAKQKVRERQQTNSLERFIQRANGDEEEGRKNWLQRQEKWLNSLEERGWYGNHSEVSQKLFRSIEELTDIPIRYGDNEITLRVGDRYCKPDCIAQSTRKIIEFFGDYWHANPEMYQADQAVRRLDEGGFITAKEIWKKDLARIELLEQHDYVVRIVWENEYTENPSETVSDCVKFLSTPLNMGCS